MNFNLNEEQLAFREAARDFAAGELAPYAAEWDEKKYFPIDVIRKAGELGFCGLYCNESGGGLGLPRLDSVIVIEELAKGCTSTAAYISIHNMVAWMVTSWGSEPLLREWQETLVTGQALGSYCLTEANAGSDAGSLRTSAKLEGDEYILNGSKMFISGAGSTDLLVVMARTGGKDSGANGISAFAVPANTTGIAYGKNESKMGWNSQPTRVISFDNVRIPKHNLLGEEGEGFKLAMKGLDGGRINIAACSVGTAQAAIEQGQQYIKERNQFGGPLADFQSVQFKLADMSTDLVAARQMVYLAASKFDENSPEKTAYCAMAKRFATDAGFNICNDTLQLHGGYGYLREYPIERFVRDTRVHQILEGTNEVMRLILARRLLQDNAMEHIR